MERMTAYCGIRCDGCPALKATMEDDNELRAKTAAQWSKEFNAEIPPEAVNCHGCTVEGLHIQHWEECGIRKCAQAKEVANCGHCADYSCEQLDKFHQMVPDARKRLDEVRSVL